MLEVQKLSDQFYVKKLDADDVDVIYEVCSENTLFYQYHPPFVTRESVLGDLSALPLGKAEKDKFFVGFYEEDTLIAVMDLILGYPEDKTAYIGFFMMRRSCQGQGIATGIISGVVTYLCKCGFETLQLAIDKGNPQSEAFWEKNQFEKTGEEYPNDDGTAYLPMIRQISNQHKEE